MATPVIPAATDVPEWRPSSPDRFEDDLAAIWRETAQTRPVSRALMSNLIVVAECAEPFKHVSALEAERPLVAVVRRHPARAILLGYTAGVSESSTPRSASVAVLTFGPPAARYGVELLAVHAACADRSIPSILRGLVVGDLPTAVWWTDDFSKPSSGEPSPAITAMGQQFLYDSAEWSDPGRGVRAVAALLGRPNRPDIADLNWRRLRTLRQAFVHGIRSDVNTGDLEPSELVIHCTPGQCALAWLMVGWLHSRIGAPPTAPEEIDGLDTDLTLVLAGPSWRMEASMKGSSVTLSGNGRRPPFTMSIPGETEAEGVVSELLVMSRDTVLEDAVKAIANII